MIPAFNEAERILPTLQSYADALAGVDARILVIDDGSHDGTTDVVRKIHDLAVPIDIKILDSNQGKGAAVLRGFSLSRRECTHVMFADADGSTPAKEFSTVFAAAEQGGDVVIASRALGTEHVKQHWLRRFMGQTFNVLFRSLVPLEFKDTQCGFKLFSRAAADLIVNKSKCHGFAFDVEWILIAEANGMKVVEVPVWWEHVEASRVRLIVDSFKMLRDLMAIRSRYRSGHYSQ